MAVSESEGGDHIPEFRLRKIAVAAFGPAILFGLAEGAVLPVIALSAIDIGATVAIASLIVSMIGIGSLVSNVPAGEITTRFGERRAMVGAAALSLCGLILCLLELNLWVFGLGIFLIGCASSVFNLARQSYLTEAVPSHMRARALSTLGGSQRIGVFIGPFLSAAAIYVVGLHGAYYVAIVGVVATGILAFRVPDLEPALVTPAAASSSSQRRLSTWQILVRYRLIFATLGIAIVLLSAVRATRQVVIPLWAVHLGVGSSTAALIYGLAGAADMLTFYPAGKVMDRWGRKWVAIPSTLVLGAAMICMPFTTTVASLAIVSMLLGFGNGIGAGLVMTLGADVAPSSSRPRFFGVWRELQDAGSALGPVFLSFMTAITTLGIAIISSGLIGLVAAAALWRWIPRHRPNHASEGTQ